MESNLGRYNKLVQLYMGEEQEINSSNPFHLTIYRKHGEEISEKKGEIDWFNSQNYLKSLLNALKSVDCIESVSPAAFLFRELGAETATDGGS